MAAMEDLDDIRCEMIAKSEEAMSNSIIEDHWRAKDHVDGLIARLPIFNGVLVTRFYESYTLMGRNALDSSAYHNADRSTTQYFVHFWVKNNEVRCFRVYSLRKCNDMDVLKQSGQISYVTKNVQGFINSFQTSKDSSSYTVNFVGRGDLVLRKKKGSPFSYA